jgi:hypothetical protein
MIQGVNEERLKQLFGHCMGQLRKDIQSDIEAQVGAYLQQDVEAKKMLRELLKRNVVLFSIGASSGTVTTFLCLSDSLQAFIKDVAVDLVKEIIKLVVEGQLKAIVTQIVTDPISVGTIILFARFLHLLKLNRKAAIASLRIATWNLTTRYWIAPRSVVV